MEGALLMESAINNDTSNPRSEGARKRCPHCGGSNKADAGWCGQCLEKFEDPIDARPADAYSNPNAESSGAPVESEGDSDETVAQLKETEAALALTSLAADTLTSMKVVTRPESGDASNGRPAPPATTSTSTSVKPSVGKTKTGDTGAFNVGDEGITWTCLRCDSVNAMEERACTVCGTTFADAIQPEKDDRPQRDPGTTAMASLFMPGAGHAYLGMWSEAVARAVISTWVVTVTIFAAVQGGGQARVMAILFGLVSTGLWAAAAHDSYREANGQSKLVLLKGKSFLYLVLGLLLMSFVMIFSTAVTAGK